MRPVRTEPVTRPMPGQKWKTDFRERAAVTAALLRLRRWWLDLDALTVRQSTCVNVYSVIDLCIHFIHSRASVRVCVCICLCACLSIAACPHYSTDPDVTWGNSRGCPLFCELFGRFAIGVRVSLLWQHSPNAKCQRVLVLALCLVLLVSLVVDFTSFQFY